ncbi:MAG: nucleotidyltransferase domain-containing protein [Theionarchaea archaeon]|nr:nucleotidyltransferase domain-containing protein [Theionarchaea archaeon]MBU7020769.1 nucleotidyltransferase domain-containing protein [Theionarchaea archaeon]MBU7035629.1 nucleotidyltransferase domain-containing protein [Theionarchaea archaeon]MBU7041168.1 nucleotidyltransferase domain-containing protein [Theionarchaea archaeon]
MEELIREICSDLEQEVSIRILFAVENGSRAWRMASSDSDYDVRFVFTRPVREYLQIKRPTQVITASFDRNGCPCTENVFIDMSGFDIFKYVELLSKSNPTAIEWLVTDIVYYGKQNEVFKDFALQYFSELALYHHYASMCRDNYKKYIQSRKRLTYKVYLYALRGLINALWVLHRRRVPPIAFRDAVQGMAEIVPPSISGLIDDIMRLKSQGTEKAKIENIPEIDEYIEGFLEDSAGVSLEKPEPPLDMLNREVQRILLCSCDGQEG